MKSMVSPTPVHVHVPKVTEVHVHWNKTPSGAFPSQMIDQRPKVQKPWIPPGRVMRNTQDTPSAQKSRWKHHQPTQTGLQKDLTAESKQLQVLLAQQERIRQSRKGNSEGEYREALLRALVEAEIDGVAVANQLMAFNKTIGSLAKDKSLPASLKQQQKTLIEKIAMFDNTNCHLRELLREIGVHERELLGASEEEDVMKMRLAKSEAEKAGLLDKLTHKEREIRQLAKHLHSEQDNVRTKEELSNVLESTRKHLESQLSRVQDENAHLETQIQGMQKYINVEKDEFQALQEELQILKQQSKDLQEKREQEALEAQECLRHLEKEAQEKESQLSEAMTASNDWYLRHSKENAAKKRLEKQIYLLNREQTKLESQLRSAEEKNRVEKEQLKSRFQLLSTEKASILLENQQLQDELLSSEDQITALRSEASLLKSSIKENEIQVSKYERKIQQVRLEAEECFLKMEVTQREMQEVNVSLQREKEQLKQELSHRLRDLDTLPNRLKEVEEQLREAKEETKVHERSSIESCAALSEVRHKVEQQGSELEKIQKNNSELQMENKLLYEKIHNLERTLGSKKLEIAELSQAVCGNEASICSYQQQLEGKTSECRVLSKQLKQTVEEAQRQVDDRMQWVLTKEKASQSKALEVQRQVDRNKAELRQLQQSKEDMEHHFQSQMQNVKERLEQSDSTNRSLNSYVQFLKSSYGNFFDSPLTS